MIVEALRSRRRAVSVHLIDISPVALEHSERALGRLDYVSVVGHRATYEEGLRHASAAAPGAGSAARPVPGLQHRQLRHAGRREVFLPRSGRPCARATPCCWGPTSSSPRRSFSSPTTTRSGVTAAFNKNLLPRINRELLARLRPRGLRSPRGLEPEASGASRCTSSRARTRSFAIPRAELTVRFAAGEPIWTESSYKYTSEEVHALGRAAGFRSRDQWIDPDARFALTLFLAD